MDPLSMAASAAGLISFVITLTVGLTDCVNKVRSADTALSSFALELTSLEKTLRSVEFCLSQPSLRDALRKAISSEDAESQLRALGAVLKDCKSALQDLEDLLKSIQSGRFAHGKLRMPAAAWRLNSKSLELGKIQTLVKTYNSAMYIHIQIMNLLLSADTVSAIQNVDQSLTSIKAEILRLRFELRPIDDGYANETNLDGGIERADINIREYISRSESILSSASEYFRSTAGTARADLTVVDYGPDQEAHVTDWISKEQNDEDIDVSSDGDGAFQHSVVSDLAIIAEEHFIKGNEASYRDAQRFYSKFLEKSKSLTWDPREIYEVQLKLAASHSAVQEYEKADEILLSMDSANCSPWQRAQILQYRAQLTYLQRNLHAAKALSEAAVEDLHKLKKGTTYYDALSLLATICNEMGEVEECVVYQRRIPTNFQPTRIPGWPPPNGSRQIEPSLNSLGTPLPRLMLGNIRAEVIPMTADSKSSSNEAGSGPSLEVTKSDQTVFEISKAHTILFVAFSSDGSGVLIASKEGPIWRWGRRSGTCELVFETDLNVTAGACASDTDYIVLGTEDGLIYAFDANIKGYPLKLRRMRRKSCVRSLAVSHEHILCGSQDESVSVWGRPSGTWCYRVKIDRGPITSVAFSPDGMVWAAGSFYGETQIRNARKGHLMAKSDNINLPIWSIAFSPLGEAVAIAGGLHDSYKICLCDPRFGKLRNEHETEDEIHSLAFSPVGECVAFGTNAGVQFWDPYEDDWPEGHEDKSAAVSVAFSATGGEVVSGHADGFVHVWPFQTHGKH